MHYSSVEEMKPEGNLADMKSAEGIVSGLEEIVGGALRYLRYIPLVVIGVLLVTSSVSYYRVAKASTSRLPNARNVQESTVSLHSLKKGEVTDILLLEDIVSRDMVPVEIRFNKPDSLTEFGEWQKVDGGIQFPHQVTFVQYRALTDTFNVRVRTPRTRS